MNAKKLIIEFAEQRKDYNNCFKSDLYFLNIAYMLIKNRLAGTPRDTDDIAIIYDNLVINCEIIDADNITEYERATVEKLTGKRYDRALNEIKAGYSYLLNYYDINGDMHETKIKLKNDYNIFTDEEIKKMIK